MASLAGTVDFTLRRNGELLGRVRISFPIANSDSGIAGMLEVEQALHDIDEMMQSTPPFLPGNPTLQTRIRDAHHGPGPVALRELSPEEAKCVPQERILVVHDAAGEPLQFRFLMIQRMPGPMPDRGELGDVCRERGIAPSPWMLMAH